MAVCPAAGPCIARTTIAVAIAAGKRAFVLISLISSSPGISMCVWWADVASSTCAAGVPTAGTSGASRDGAPGRQINRPLGGTLFWRVRHRPDAREARNADLPGVAAAFIHLNPHAARLLPAAGTEGGRPGAERVGGVASDTLNLIDLRRGLEVLLALHVDAVHVFLPAPNDAGGVDGGRIRHEECRGCLAVAPVEGIEPIVE